MFSSGNQAPGVIMLKELPPDMSSVMYLDVVSIPIVMVWTRCGDDDHVIVLTCSLCDLI